MKKKLNGLLFHVVVIAHAAKLWSVAAQVQRVRECLTQNLPITQNPYAGF